MKSIRTALSSRAVHETFLLYAVAAAFAVASGALVFSIMGEAACGTNTVQTEGLLF